MARTRYLKPGFFQNDRLAELGPWHRLLFAGLWTIADRSGRLEDRPKRIKGELFPYDDVDVDALLADLSSGVDPFVIRYEAGGMRCLCLPKWALHQKPHNNEAPSILPSHRNAKIIEEKDGLAPKSEPSTTKDRSEHNLGPIDSHLNENLNENSNGEWGTGTGNAVPAPAPVFDVESASSLAADLAGGERSDGGVWRKRSRTPGLMPGPIAHERCYPSAGCGRGLCVPRFISAEWLGQCEGDATYADQFIANTLRFTPAGPQGDPVKWWRAKWDEKHRAPTPVSTKSSRTLAAGVSLDEKLAAGAEIDPFGTKAHARQLADKASA